MEKNEEFREKCSTLSGPSHVLFKEMLDGSVGASPAYSRNSEEAEGEGGEW